MFFSFFYALFTLFLLNLQSDSQFFVQTPQEDEFFHGNGKFACAGQSEVKLMKRVLGGKEDGHRRRLLGRFIAALQTSNTWKIQ